jgi:hypothetical protein
VGTPTLPALLSKPLDALAFATFPRLSPKVFDLVVVDAFVVSKVFDLVAADSDGSVDLLCCATIIF